MTDSPSVATADQFLPGNDPTDLTDPHRSKLSPDDPRLKLPRTRPRTLKKGPAIAVASGVVAFAAIAVVLALNPQAAPAPKEQAPEDQVSLAQAFPIPDTIKNAPDNSSPVFTGAVPPPSTPRLGEPLPGQETAASPAAHHAAGGVPGPEEQRRLERVEAFHKARASGLFFSGDDPTPAERPSEATAPSSSAQVQQLLAARASGTANPVAAPGRQAGPGDDPNLQDRKNDFVARDGTSDASYLQHALSRPRSPYEVKAGTIIPTVLLTGLNSDLPGEVIGQVRENVFDTVTGNHLLIPQGSRLLAKYDSMVAFGQERVLVCWNRLIRPDGSSLNLECMPGVDLAGYAGFADRVDHHWWRVLSGVVLGSLLAATAARSQGDIQGLQPTFPQIWASNAASQVNQAGQQITQKNLAIQPTITVRPGFSVNVLVSKDMVIPPYSRGR
jgi:type IV secretory pathway VirB10-like protein